MDFSRLRTGEQIAGIGGLALFILLFFDWYGAGGGFDEGGLSGWDALGGDGTGFIVALTAVAGIALVVLAASGQRLNVPLRRGAITAVLGSLSVAIILWRLIANGQADLKVGIFLGLIAAGAVAYGAIQALREDGFEPLVAVAGGRTRAASAASAPKATPARRKTTTTRKKTSSRSTRSRKK